MLKITADRDAGRAIFKLEGRLTGPWVEELKICWQKSVAAGQPIKGVALDEVIFIDEAGKELLADMSPQMLPGSSVCFRFPNCVSFRVQCGAQV